MENNLLYLKEETYFEPLFNHWYAWPYLIPPATAARHMVNTHRRIMLSFVKNYKLHIMAVKESVLTGAEFLNCSESQVDDIKRLVEELDEKCGELIELSDAIKELDDLVFEHTSGESIEYLYAKVPNPLKGYVEIFMDMEHRASYRLIEPLLYRSEFYKSSLQSLSFGVLSRVEERPFVLSTPRLPDSNHLQVRADFNAPVVDAIFSAREKPIPADKLADVFGGYAAAGGLSYRDLFTDEKSLYPYVPVDDGVRLQYTGHAGFVIESKNTRILVDPVIASRGMDNAEEVISYSELPPVIDYILLTHSHSDHVNIETLLQLRYKTRKVLVPKNNGGTLADPSLRLLLSQLNFNVQEVDDLEETQLADGRLVSVPFLGEHGDLNIRSKTAWFIELCGKKCFFGADSSNPDENLYRHLGKIFADIDVLAIGMECVGAPYTWIYGALHTKIVSKAIKNSRRLNGSDCAQALPMVKAFGAKEVYIYALGLEPWYKYFMGIEYDENSRQVVESNKFLEACRDIKVKAESLYGKKTIYLDA
ncbi:MBL fold metallo-hydrolase [Exilibacterium tricleocarpae]|uniref:MBL fold metallo-hydrolase n=1 Tax=Exilibacterium tricleocarpae TaxID=2591008 RepID=A0A545TFU7_9GAMM|nr:MBL fold metallo-hydrolase [Exilibacterium tricleocarpae]TQV76051.1 MBL fold metallo-hydrolase [Exilibacterium tricleocarpae]